MGRRVGTQRKEFTSRVRSSYLIKDCFIIFFSKRKEGKKRKKKRTVSYTNYSTE